MAVDVDGAGHPARAAAPGPAAAVAVRSGLAPAPGLASEAALVPLSAPEHTATQLPLLGDEMEPLSHEQRIATSGPPRVTSEPQAVSAAAPGPRARRARATHPIQRAPRVRAGRRSRGILSSRR